MVKIHMSNDQRPKIDVFLSYFSKKTYIVSTH